MMLGRVAGNLFWTFRYLERAENMARFADAGLRISLTHMSARDSEWSSVLQATGTSALYRERHGDIDNARVLDFLLRDRDNPSSVHACLERARTNARLARTALTREVWEAVNESWLKLHEELTPRLAMDDLWDTLRLIRQHCQLVQGAMQSTMLRNDIFGFSSLGMLVERADATARTVDVKYYVLLPSIAQVGTPLDNVQWQTLLRATSSERAYHWLHGGEVSAVGITRFLLLDHCLPRSLAYCYEAMLDAFEPIMEEDGPDAEEPDSLKMVRYTDQMLRETRIDRIFELGLHEFLQDFVARNYQLAAQIEQDFRFME